MMFVRTKDGVYEVSEENDRYFKCCYDGDRVTLVAKFGNDVNGFSKALKQANTIEELCDQIVCGGILYQNKITRDGYCCLVEDNFEELEEPITVGMLKEGIYGAIWTDKGLIYVAKMNEKGVLCLI